MRNVWRALLFFAVSGFVPVSAAENHVAVDFWGFAHHADREKGYNEKNWGLGLRLYHGNWFVAADEMRNSVRGQTLALGGGYEHLLFRIKGFDISVAAELAHLNYQVPDYLKMQDVGGKRTSALVNGGTIHGNIIIPFLSVRKSAWGGNVALIPPKGRRRAIWLFSATYHFNAF